MNDDSTLQGFQLTSLSVVRQTQVIGDGLMSPTSDTHNGLLAMLVGVPSTVSGGEEVTLL